MVPVELPDGMSYEGLTGEKAPVAPPPPAAAPPVRKPPAPAAQGPIATGGGVPNVGTGGDPFKQAMQNTLPRPARPRVGRKHARCTPPSARAAGRVTATPAT